jgi:hypothetical protein
MCEGVSGTCKPGWMLVLVFFAMQIGAGAFLPLNSKKNILNSFILTRTTLQMK